MMVQSRTITEDLKELEDQQQENNQRRINKLKRTLWLIDGVIRHALDLFDLLELYKIFEMEDHVPTHSDYKPKSKEHGLKRYS